jgi:choline dehydrogenase-like flavoprotein
MGKIYQHFDIHEDRTEEADACVIGSGAGGSVLAYELASAGKSVVLLESGGYYTAKDYTQRDLEMNNLLYVDGARQGPPDGSVLVLQGKCVGGSTTVTALVCFRTPDFILEDWAENYGITGYSPSDLDPHFSKVERFLHVTENSEEEINNNSRMFRKGARKLGISVAPIKRNVIGCQLCGFCIYGCAYQVRQDSLTTYVPAALSAGATLYADTEAEEIVVVNGRAAGVRASVRDRATGRPLGRLTVKSKIVVLAAGSIQSPLLLLKNKLANSSGQVGKNFALRPSPERVRHGEVQ